MKDELVLAFRSSLIETVGGFQGLNKDYKRYWDVILRPDNAKFLSRKQIENDPSYKQIIPYVLIKFEDSFLYYVRGKRSGEQRLVANGSLGIGGHVSIIDDDMITNPNLDVSIVYKNAVKREVAEEVVITSQYTDTIVGVLNDDSNDVGRVHFGIVHLWVIDSPNVKKRESKITQLSFLSTEELKVRITTLESWSKICFNNILAEGM
jgi:predicted NUDIX family phosphoesterase